MHQPEIIIEWKDSFTDAAGWLVIDRLINGVCGGGTFMHAAATEKEVIDLARTMSWKNSLQRIPFGGAKAGIRYDHTLPDATLVLQRFLQFLKPWLETVWCTGSDLNTSNDVINRIVTELGIPSMFGTLGKMVARKYEISDQSQKIYSRMTHEMTPYFSLAEGATGYSVTLSVATAFKHDMPRIFIQGFGSVGRSLAYFAHTMGTGIVSAICDISGTICSKDGIDSEEILKAYNEVAKQKNLPMDQWLSDKLKEKYNFRKRKHHVSDAEQITETLSGQQIDVFSPCAARYTVTENLIHNMNNANPDCWIISGANNVFDSFKTFQLATSKGIKCFPEWISNSGNAILYEELLAIPEMPEDYIHHFKHAIRDRIHSFLQESNFEFQNPEQWNNIFTQTAEARLLKRPTIAVTS